MKKITFCALAVSAGLTLTTFAAGGYRDPNPYANYGAAMRSTPQKQSAVDWSKANDAALKVATSEASLAACVATPAAAKTLLAQVKGPYATSPIAACQIAAVSQYVMRPGRDAQRRIWTAALGAQAKGTKDAYVRKFCLDQLRWCGYQPQAIGARELFTAHPAKTGANPQ